MSPSPPRGLDPPESLDSPDREDPLEPPSSPPRASAEPFSEARPGAWRALAPPARGPEGRRLRELCKRAGALSATHGLLREGDRVLAALSGGKDSFALLEVLLSLQGRAPIRFELGAVVVDPGFEGFRARAVAAFAAERGVATWIVRADIGATLQALAWRRAPCALCARLRRGVLYRVAPELGFSTLALGHHADDAMETVLLNMFFNGQLRGLAPLWRPADPGAPRVIRPLVTCFEADLAAYARTRAFRLVEPACPLCTVPETERVAIKHLLTELSAEHPRLRQSLLASLANVAPDSLMDLELQQDLGLIEGPREPLGGEAKRGEPPRAGQR